MIRKSSRWIAVVYTLLAVVALAAAFTAGLLEHGPLTSVRTVRVVRPPISASASLHQVEANFAGRPYVHGQLQELPGFDCYGWTNGANSHGWVVLRCSK